MKTTKLSLLLLAIDLIANEGQIIGNDMRQHFSGDFKTNVSNPITSDTQFKTVDGTKNFNANLTCNEQTNSFLDISYTGNSDITVYINIDTNLDGNKNKSFSFSGISGIGTNGVIKCTPNTWNNCTYYLWNLSNDNLSLQSANRYDLGGGYCINSSCGSLAATENTNILDTLGGAVSSLYQNSDTQYLITKTSNDGNTIEFYGQNYEECRNHQQSTSTPAYNQIDDSSLNTDELLVEQLNDDTSVYYTFNENIENQNENDFDDDMTDIKTARKSVSATGDTSDYTFTYNAKQKDEDGNWVAVNDSGSVNIDFLNPDIKYCEVKYLKENSTVFSDGETHQSSIGNTQVWHTQIKECTGDNYTVCPVDTDKGEIIKHPCGDIDNFAEVTSALMAVEEATDDISCSSN